MDSVERALRSGGEREAAKKTEEDAGTIAGAAARPALLFLCLLMGGADLPVALASRPLNPSP
jgi:hypothetical protein